MEEVDRLAQQSHSVVISCEMELNLDILLSRIWDLLALIRVYTKKRGGRVYIRGGAKLLTFANRSLMRVLLYRINTVNSEVNFSDFTVFILLQQNPH